jgi:hypothetical protein
MAQQVTIVGTMTDAEGNTKQVTITGVGAIAPVDPGYGVPAPPLGIWGGPPLHPAHPIAPGGPPPTVAPPIYYPPVFPAHPIVTPPVGIAPPIYYPPGIWGPTDPRPSHPIVLPEPPEVPTEPPIAPPGGGISDGWQWYYTPGTGWILVWKPPGSGGKPQPPGGSAPTPSPTKG